MINSLSKDSHITRSQKRPIIHNRIDNNLQKSSNSTVAYKHINFNTVIDKPAQTSFSGFLRAKDVKEFICNDFESLNVTRRLIYIATGNEVKQKTYFMKNILAAAKDFVSDGKVIAKEDKVAIKEIHNSTKKIIEKSVDALQNPKKKIEDEAVKKFLKTGQNRKTINELLKKINNETKLVNKKEDEFPFDITDTKYQDFVKEKVNESVDVLHSVENPSWLYKSEGFKKFLKKAEKSQAVFSATLGAVLACVLRPLTIVSLPGEKNKGDKKYASAHSIASGAIGYFFAMLISSPIAKGIEKIANNPEKFLEEKHMANYISEKDIKNKTSFAKTKRYSIARGYLNLIPEFLTAPIKAGLTIALIPPILKYVFGLEKSSHKVNNHNPSMQDGSNLAFKSTSEPVRKVFQSFIGESK